MTLYKIGHYASCAPYRGAAHHQGDTGAVLIPLEEYNRQKHHGEGSGPFIGAYENKPRGRIFYLPDEEPVPEAKELVLEEFDLPAQNTVFEYAIHWNIGHSWC